MLIVPSACRWCGVERHDHWGRWADPVGWHQYVTPTQEQIKARMLERRTARMAVRTATTR
jgi:hypothetical protein